MDNNNQEKTESQLNDKKSETTLRDLIGKDRLVIEEGQEPLWYLSREDMGLPPVPNEKPENNEEKTPDWKINKEDMGLVDMQDKALTISGPAYVSNGLPQPEIFGQGGTNFSEVLSKAFEEMQKSNPDTPKHIFIVTDGDNGDLIESLTTTTYNEEQKKAALKEMPETEFKEVSSNVEPEKKIDWREALRRHFQSAEGGQKITFSEDTLLDISFTGIPKPENEPVSKLDPIVLYSMEPQSMGPASPETNTNSKEDLLQRIKNVNNNLSSDNKNDNDNKPKLK